MHQSLQVGGATITVDAPAGPYLRIAGTGIVLTVAGQRATADVSLEKATSYGADGVPGGTGSNADSQIIRIAASNVSLALGDGTRNVLTLSNGEALLIYRGTGIAARIGGTVPCRTSRASRWPAPSPSRRTRPGRPSTRASPSVARSSA